METFFVLLLLMGLLIAVSFLGNRAGRGRPGASHKPGSGRASDSTSAVIFPPSGVQAGSDPSQPREGTPSAAAHSHAGHDHHAAHTPPAHHHNQPASFEAPPVTHTHIDTSSMGHHHGG